MKKFTVIANCQRVPLINGLKSNKNFSGAFSEFVVPPVFMFKEEHFKKLDVALKDIDLVIYQPVVNRSFKSACSEYIESVVPKSKRIKIPNLYFSGYHPGLFEFKLFGAQNENLNNALSASGPQHYRFVLEQFLMGKKPKEISDKILQGGGVDIQAVRENCEKSLIFFEDREAEFNLDIRVSEYIKKTYQSEKLFHIHNHPSNELLSYFIFKIFDELGIDKYQIDTLKGKEVLGHVKPIIFPAVYRALGLNFSNDLVFGISNDFYNLENWIDKCFELYSVDDFLTLKNYKLAMS